jgi:pyruvate-ferredoxin/flavodoxin oxidoreductase
MSKAKVPYPGIPTTSDGAGTVVWVETHISQAAAAYPITPSTPMGQGFQAQVAAGMKNLWGDPLIFMELESEHSSASACEGFALAGGRVTNFTSGQGLILMKEVLYTISGKRLPIVFHIGARALTSHSLNVHAGHDDVMGVADTGWGMLFARNAQEAGDLALIARRAAEDSLTPFFNVQDGFLTTHTVENVLLPEPELMREYVGRPEDRLTNWMDPSKPVMSGVVQNQDSYMKGKIAQRYFYELLPSKLKAAMEEYYQLTGRRYGMVDLYRMEDAEFAIVGMGSFMETAMATIDYLRREKGIKVGAVHVTAFRPFPGPEIVEALRQVRAVSVLERMDCPPAQSNPLTAEIKAAFADALQGAPGYPRVDSLPTIYSGSGGLGSRDVRPGHFVAIVDNMLKPREQAKWYFSVGIKHPTALDMTQDPDVRPQGAFSMRGYSVGGFGSVTTNKVIATLVAELFGLQVQAYPKYGSEKKGLPTNYYLTVAHEHIRTHCELEHVEFVALNDFNAFYYANPFSGLAEGGALFVDTRRESPQELWADIPEYAKKVIRERRIRLYGLDTVRIARSVATAPDLVQRMQGIALLGVFLRITPFREEARISEEQLFSGVEKYLRKYFGRRGEAVIRDNMEVVRRGYHEVFEVPRQLMEAGQVLAATL